VSPSIATRLPSATGTVCPALPFTTVTPRGSGKTSSSILLHICFILCLNLALLLSSHSLLRVAFVLPFTLSHPLRLHAATSILSMKTTAWLATFASVAPALAMPGLSGFAGTQRGNWKISNPAQQHQNTPRADDSQSSGPPGSSSLSEPASNPPPTESIWGERFIAALQMIGKGKDSFSYVPAASAESHPSPEVAPTTVVSVITEYVSATPTAVPYLDELTITIYTTFFEEVCTKTDTWTMDGTVFSSSYETVTTSSSIDFYNPNSPTAAPETTHCSHSDISVLTPAQSHEPIHPSGDSIVTSTSISIFLTTATETHLHTVRPSAGHNAPSAPVDHAGGNPSPAPTTSSRAPPSNYGSISLTHSTKSAPSMSVPFSFPSDAEHESGHMKPSSTRVSWSFEPTHSEQHGI
jgi:hypothetical protein